MSPLRSAAKMSAAASSVPRSAGCVCGTNPGAFRSGRSSSVSAHSADRSSGRRHPVDLVLADVELADEQVQHAVAGVRVDLEPDHGAEPPA